MHEALQTGQRRCYDAQGEPIVCSGSGQDAEFASGLLWPQPRFEARGPVVIDRLTMLVWTRNALPAKWPLTWAEAFGFIDQINSEHYGGCSDWRLPNRRELRSLISHQARRPTLAEDHPFDDVFCGWYWSSTTATISPAHAWNVDMDGGRMFYGGKDQSYMVWPVRGSSAVLPRTGQTDCYDSIGQRIACSGCAQDGAMQKGAAWPSPRFAVHGAVVLDRLTGLHWCRMTRTEDGALYWHEALERVARQRARGGTLRLPNINELESLVDCARHSPALPADHPFEGLKEAYWSATTSVYEPDWAWALYLDKGAVGVGFKNYAKFHVWLIDDCPKHISPS